MASAAGVAGVRATLDLGSKSSKCVQCGEPDSARITGKQEVILQRRFEPVGSETPAGTKRGPIEHQPEPFMTKRMHPLARTAQRGLT